jgi:acetyl-CoA carboxylase carboxyltransferase component
MSVNTSDEGRALLTEREREILSGDGDEASPEHRRKTRSVVRKRIRRHLGEDASLLATHFPNALADATDALESAQATGIDPEDSFWDSAGMAESGRGDLAANHDEYLYGEQS